MASRMATPLRRIPNGHDDTRTADPERDRATEEPVSEKRQSRRGTPGPGAGAGRRRHSAPAALYDGRTYDGEYGDGDTLGICGSLGKRGSGKTFRDWISIQLSHARLVVFDSENQYRPPNYDTAGFTVISSPGELKKFIASHLNDERVRVIYKPLDGKKLWHFRAVTYILLQWGKRLHEKGKGLIFDVDEVDQFCPPHEKLEIFSPELNKVVEYGRHQGISMRWNARRIYTVHPKVRAATREYRIYRYNEPLDNQYFEKVIGKDAAAALPALGKYEYVFWTDDAHQDWEIRGGKQ